MNEYQARMGAAIKRAQKNVQALKKAAPYIFPEWQALRSAKANVKEANEALARAKAAWNAIGGEAK